MSTTRLILVRHGETIANREYRYVGSRDDELSSHGQAQAEQLAEALSILPVAAVYTSPLQRAHSTALSIAARHGLKIQTIDDLREVSFGAWEGLSRAEVLARSPEDAQYLRDWEKN